MDSLGEARGCGGRDAWACSWQGCPQPRAHAAHLEQPFQVEAVEEAVNPPDDAQMAGRQCRVLKLPTADKDRVAV